MDNDFFGNLLKIKFPHEHTLFLLAYLIGAHGHQGKGWHRTGETEMGFEREEDRQAFARVILGVHGEVGL